ncbi:hypothetical protein OROGR_024065 [Orobanche gracilis]
MRRREWNKGTMEVQSAERKLQHALSLEIGVNRTNQINRNSQSHRIDSPSDDPRLRSLRSHVQKFLRGSQEQQAHQMSTDSWYPPSVVSSPSSSRPATPGANTSSSTFGSSRQADRPNALSNVSPAEAASIIAVLKHKRVKYDGCYYIITIIYAPIDSVDELKKLLSDKEAYQNLLHSVEPVKTQNRKSETNLGMKHCS